MKYLILTVVLISCFSVSGQTVGENDEGTVSYATSQNVYVKFYRQRILLLVTLYICVRREYWFLRLL